MMKLECRLTTLRFDLIARRKYNADLMALADGGLELGRICEGAYSLGLVSTMCLVCAAVLLATA